MCTRHAVDNLRLEPPAMLNTKFSGFSVFCIVFCGFVAVGTAPAAAQNNGLQARIDATEARVLKLPRSQAQSGAQVEYQVQIDAMAIIDDWRAHEPRSQSGTQGRSNVRINGTLSNRMSGGHQVLLACRPGAFLDVTFGETAADGSVTFTSGPRDGCPAGQALYLSGGQLSCRWYRLGLGNIPAGLNTGSLLGHITLATYPPVHILGECITATAELEPALVFPQRQVSGGECGGSGVTINGRATGHSATCGD